MATRPRGWIEWNPQPKTLQQIAAVKEVLETYRDYLPLTIRQIYYRLVVSGCVEKTEKGYNNLCETLNKGRRSGLISMNAIRDDGPTQQVPISYDTGAEYLRTEIAYLEGKGVQFDRQRDQERRLAVWCEAAGMAPMLVPVARKYGIAVYSSGGFDSLTFKYEMSNHIKGHIVIHLGDYDPSGVHMFSSLEEDVMAFDLSNSIEFIRLAVLPEHIEEYDLPTAPPKKSDKRKFNDHRTVQCEAFPPDTLLELLEAELLEHIDLSIYEQNITREEEVIKELVQGLESIITTL